MATADREGMGERVFVCDDDDGYRMLLREVLGAAGMQIVGEGGDGEACSEAVAQADPDVVLVDLNMPGTNGFEALSLFRASAPHAKLIVLATAPADQQSVSAARMLGADGYVSKPFDIFAVPSLVREALASEPHWRTP